MCRQETHRTWSGGRSEKRWSVHSFSVIRSAHTCEGGHQLCEKTKWENRASQECLRAAGTIVYRGPLRCVRCGL